MLRSQEGSSSPPLSLGSSGCLGLDTKAASDSGGMGSRGSGPPSLHPKPPLGACGEGGRRAHQSLGSEGLALFLAPPHAKSVWRARLQISFGFWSADVHLWAMCSSLVSASSALPQLPGISPAPAIALGSRSVLLTDLGPNPPRGNPRTGRQAHRNARAPEAGVAWHVHLCVCGGGAGVPRGRPGSVIARKQRARRPGPGLGGASSRKCLPKRSQQLCAEWPAPDSSPGWETWPSCLNQSSSP